MAKNTIYYSFIIKKNCFFVRVDFFMRKILFISIILSSLASCNDGDVIVTDFNFINNNLKTCGGIGSYTFYNINNSSAAESISLVLETNDILFIDTGINEYPLNGTSYLVNYRKYDADIDDNYFCSSIPPVSPNVIDEYYGASGLVQLKTIVVKDDEDGIIEDATSELDSDNDGLLDFFDNDDDGDNVPTINELGPDFLEGISEFPLDTDGDLIPDYLDVDDDNDLILTRYEDANGDLDPTNDFTTPNIPDYLNENIADNNIIDQYRIHSYQLTSDIELIINNLILVNGSEQITKETMVLGNQNNVIDGTVSLTPEF